MKRIFALILCLVMLVGVMTGCGARDRELYAKTDLSKYVELTKYKGITVDTSSDDFKEIFVVQPFPFHELAFYRCNHRNSASDSEGSDFSEDKEYFPETDHKYIDFWLKKPFLSDFDDKIKKYFKKSLKKFGG